MTCLLITLMDLLLMLRPCVITKHTTLCYSYIQIHSNIQIQYLSTKDMIADFLTKPLIGQQFYKLRDLLLGYTTL